MMPRPNDIFAAVTAMICLTVVPLVAADEPVSPDGAFSEAIQIAQRRTVKIYGAGIGRSPADASGRLVSSTATNASATDAFVFSSATTPASAGGSAFTR